MSYVDQAGKANFLLQRLLTVDSTLDKCTVYSRNSFLLPPSKIFISKVTTAAQTYVHREFNFGNFGNFGIRCIHLNVK
jgi:hypothetical protein